MNPYLDRHYNPRLKLDVLLSDWVTCDCRIDTGFSGGIALPMSYQVGFHKKPALFQEYELADGSHVTVDLYDTKARYNRTSKELTLFFTRSAEGLVGIEFLTGFKFVLDLRKILVAIE